MYPRIEIVFVQCSQYLIPWLSWIKISVEKSDVILMFTFICYLIFLSYNLQYCLLVLCANCLTCNMPWRGCILVMSVWCPTDFLYLDGHLFLKIWEVFCYYYIECISYAFCLHLFFFDAQDLQVWFFDSVTEFLHIPLANLQSFL
jgi:hypothetical protein